MVTFRAPEKIESAPAGSGFTAEIIAARESYITGSSGIGE